MGASGESFRRAHRLTTRTRPSEQIAVFAQRRLAQRGGQQHGEAPPDQTRGLAPGHAAVLRARRDVHAALVGDAQRHAGDVEHGGEQFALRRFGHRVHLQLASSR